VSVVIWTTTPWTLPANEAVTLRAEIEYVAACWSTGRRAPKRGAGAGGRLLGCLPRRAMARGQTAGRFAGAALEGLQLEHPWLAKQVPVILGDHVTLEAGTGAVHTAPAHGQEDFIVGQTLRLPVVNPVGA
jgi:isoleucyl-tRNA synthetase